MEHAIDYTKFLLKKKDYKQATTWLKSALTLFPKLKYSFEMLIISETLYYHTITPQPDWYSVLHLHPSASDSEMNAHCETLIKFTKLMESETFPGATDALGVLNQAKSVLCNQPSRHEYDCMRKESGLVDLGTENKKGWFREDYLCWKPPILSSDVVDIAVDVEELHSRKRGITNAPLTPNYVVDEETALSPEMKKLKHQLFDEMPQRPHFAPLEKYNTKVGRGMIMGLDLAFVNLCEEIRRLEDPQMLWTGLDDFMEQVVEMEGMGYSMEKVRRRLENLKEIAGRDRVCREEVEEVEAEKKKQETKIEGLHSLVLELEAEIEKARVLGDKNRNNIDFLERNDGGC